LEGDSTVSWPNTTVPEFIENCRFVAYYTVFIKQYLSDLHIWRMVNVSIKVKKYSRTSMALMEVNGYLKRMESVFS